RKRRLRAATGGEDDGVSFRHGRFRQDERGLPAPLWSSQARAIHRRRETTAQKCAGRDRSGRSETVMDSYGGGSGLVVCTVFKTAGRRQWWLRWVRFPHAPARILAVLIGIAAVGLVSRPASAQIPFPTPAARQDTSGKDT